MIGSIQPRDLKTLLAASPNAILLDVREPFERELAKLPATANVTDLFIPMREIPARVDEVHSVLNTADAPIIVYCHHGIRSLRVAAWLVDQGFNNVHNLVGGIDAYTTDVDPSIPSY